MELTKDDSSSHALDGVDRDSAAYDGNQAASE